mmetsp:Transcript_27156/g.59663  ORF Transcript_27156/g.59663 Transcript_27156/m.59663 type:complete len:244 (-) Transcript_27156:535-1266(-)
MAVTLRLVCRASAVSTSFSPTICASSYALNALLAIDTASSADTTSQSPSVPSSTNSSSGLKGSDRNSGMALRPFGFSFVCDSKQPIARVTVCTPSKRSSSNVAPSRIARSRSLLTTPVCAVVRETARPARQSTALQSPSPATVRHRPPLQSSNVIAVLPENRFCDPLASSITSFSVTRNPSNNARLADASSLSTTLEDKTLRYNASWQYWDVCASPWPLNTPKKAKSLLRCTVLRSCMEPQPA